MIQLRCLPILSMVLLLFFSLQVKASPPTVFQVGLKDFELKGNVKKVEYQRISDGKINSQGVMHFNQSGNLIKEKNEYINQVQAETESDMVRSVATLIYDNNGRLKSATGRFDDEINDYDVTLSYHGDEELPRISVTKQDFVTTITKYFYENGRLSKDITLFLESDRMSLMTMRMREFEYNSGDYIEYIEALNLDNHLITESIIRDEKDFIIKTIFSSSGYSDTEDRAVTLYRYPKLDSQENWLKEEQVDAETNEVTQVRTRTISYY